MNNLPVFVLIMIVPKIYKPPRLHRLVPWAAWEFHRQKCLPAHETDAGVHAAQGRKSTDRYGIQFEIRSSSKDVYHGVENGNRCVGYNLSKSLNLIVISVHRAHVLFMERIEKATCMRWSRACMLEVFGRVSEIIWLLWRCATNGFWQRLGCAAVVKVYGPE